MEMMVPSAYTTSYDPTYGHYQYPMPLHMIHQPLLPVTPTTSYIPPFPDTTVKSEFGDSPSSSGSSSNFSKKKFKSPEDEKRYRVKRDRNNEAAKKSRKSRKEKEMTLMEENTCLKNALKAANHEIVTLKAQLGACHVPFNVENIAPLSYLEDSKAFQGNIRSVGLHSQ